MSPSFDLFYGANNDINIINKNTILLLHSLLCLLSNKKKQNKPILRQLYYYV